MTLFGSELLYKLVPLALIAVVFFAGWVSRMYYATTDVKAERIYRFILGSLVMIVWAVASFQDIFSQFNVPRFIHVFAAFVLIPVLDPKGNTIDAITDIISNE